MKRLTILLSLICFFHWASAQNSDTAFVYFAFDRYELTQDAKTVLAKFISNTREENKKPIRLRGHCDARGSDDYNDVLSEKRVRAVRDYLVQQGIDGTRISETAALGEREPLNNNATEDERQRNRRVEVIWQEEDVQTPGDNPIGLKEKIDTVTEGQTIRLQNINFYGGRHTFLPQSLPALNELLDVMKKNPTLVIAIEGHICCFTGSEDGMDYDSNDRRLSHNRARAVYHYLLDNGIDKSRMSYEGFAGTRLLVFPEQTDADRTLNRRVEIRIVKK